MNYLQKLQKLGEYRGRGPEAERICSEIAYLDGVSANRGGAFDRRLEAAADFVLSEAEKEGAITRGTVRAAEEMLADLGPEAKRYTALFISHAHIDMNWMWGYNETAALTVDTFRTVLDFMREYPDVTFGQSQASTYEIVEKYCPELLDEIRLRIREGRWEVTAAEWVEPDKNMPDGESLTRQILQSRKYLSGLLGIDPASLDLDFVPDTFGHNINVPEILADAGVRYMYHCRGADGPCVYYYVSPSGKRTLNFREYEWYNGEITPHKFEIVPAFCAREHVDTYLCVFGVGDHGGGPSRRDIEHVHEYASWPLTPTIRFGTFHEFFRRMEESGVRFPERTEEMNCLFTGCYTTQTRIKMANRIGEARLNETEALSAAAALLADAPREPDRLDGAWRRILSNHFPALLPGSGTVETREFAMGRFQEALASVNVYGGLSMRRIAAAVDTSGIPFEEPAETVSEGGGVGFAQDPAHGYRFPSAERGRGPVRAFHLFNPTGHDREEFAELVVWDYNEPFETAVMTDAEGAEIPFAVRELGKGYWGHRFARLYVRARVPAFGYATVILRPRVPEGRPAPVDRSFEKTDEHINDAPVVLENARLRAVFDKPTMRLVSLADKATGEELISSPACFFRYIDENPLYRMTAWRVGLYTGMRDLNAASDVRVCELKSDACQSRVVYEMKFGGSSLRCTVELKADSPLLTFDVTADWNEPAVPGERIPQIQFAVPVAYASGGRFLCDVPYGLLERRAVAHDVPALSGIAPVNQSGRSVILLTDSKYGYRFWEDTASVTLIRSACDPDPYPERGVHHFRIGLGAAPAEDLPALSEDFRHPIACVPAAAHGGSLPLSASALTVEGDVRVSCLKQSENGAGVAVRLYETAGKDADVALRFCRKIAGADLADSNETPIRPLAAEGETVRLTVPARSVVTVVIRF